MNPAAAEKHEVGPTIFKSDDYLAPSPIKDDGGHLIGRLPQEIPVDILRTLRVPENPVKAIRAKCIDCSGGNAAEARKCVAFRCPLWPFRLGKNPFWGKSDDDADPPRDAGTP
jgi:hypothetical protein